jgi:DNA repair exonuclease SbcCD nuclease subunit
MISFLHAADLHLGLRITRFDEERTRKVREARFVALGNILRVAREQSVDFLLLAGDLFDDHAVDATTARRAYEMLAGAECPVPVLVISGNHDPFLSGSVWDRSPWNKPATPKVRLLREQQPEELAPGIMLFPCPLFRKTSMIDPTKWIAQHPPDGKMRLGLAHGSLLVRDDLPIDDHLIDRQAAHNLGLDYLALGHWHRRQQFPGPDGIVRTAYCGVHEPMRFQGNSEDGTGWSPYTHGQRLEEFLDSGQGEILHVTLEEPGSPPQLRAISVGHLQWHSESRQLANAADLDRLITELSQRSQPETRLLQLRLQGTLDAQAMQRLEELKQILEGRFAYGDLDVSEVRLQPTAEEVSQLASQGIVRRLVEKLMDLQRQDASQAALVEKSLLILYQIMQEVAA